MKFRTRTKIPGPLDARPVRKAVVFRQEAQRYRAFRRYAARKGLKIGELLDRLTDQVVEAGRERKPGEPPPVDPFPNWGRPLDGIDQTDRQRRPDRAARQFRRFDGAVRVPAVDLEP